MRNDFFLSREPPGKVGPTAGPYPPGCCLILRSRRYITEGFSNSANRTADILGQKD
jgi:hypothetical protein